MIILDEKNFEQEIAHFEKVLVFFYRESGCVFCNKMKPIVESLSMKEDLGFVVAKYELGSQPDSINNKYPINRFPTFYAFDKGEVVGKYEGALEEEQLPLVFTPDLLPQPSKSIAIEKASLLQLMTDEANLIDQIAPMRSHLAKIQKEISNRKKLAEGKIGSCCDSCADGGSCGDH